MFGVIFYIGACLLVAGVITFFWTVTRPIQNRDEMKSWRTFAWMFAFSLALPYGFFESITRLKGNEMKDAVEIAYDDAETDGELKYYKVFWYTGDKATVMAVGQATLSWGGTERPTVKVNLVRNGSKWKAESYDVVTSDKLNKDGTVFPPYF